MPAASTKRVPGLPGDYYAPNVRIEVDGKELDPASKGDLLSVKITKDINSLANFELTVNDWDDQRFAFKYSDTATFDIGNRVQLHLGYADRLVPMIRGPITALSPRFPDSGAPSMTVSGHDALFCLRDRKPDQKKDAQIYRDKTYGDIAKIIGGRNGLQVKVGEGGERYPIVVQKSLDDAQFLHWMAKRIDAECYIDVDPTSGEDTLFFIPPPDGRGRDAEVYVFTWGEDLINFTPRISVARQVNKITVRGWDPATKQVIKYTATSKELFGKTQEGTSGPDAVKKCLAGGEASKQEVTVDLPVTSAQEAREYARTLLQERANQFITGTAQVIGLPELRPGTNLELGGLGKRFSGMYYVTKVEHSYGSGYRTQVEVRKTFDGGVRA